VGRRFVDLRTIQRRMQFKDDRVNAAMRKAEAMTGLVTQTHAELPSPEVIGQVLLGGDLAKLTPA